MRGKTVEVKCANKSCGCMFTARVADRNRGWGKFCSKSCKAIRQEQSSGGQYHHHKKALQCKEEHGFYPVSFSRDGSMYGADGQGVNEYGDPCFVGVADFDNTAHPKTSSSDS